jgi:phage terminase small subunit
MGKPRTPTSVLEARGTFLHDPSRSRVDPDTSGPLGPPPEHFAPELQSIWNEIASIAPVDVLSNADRFLIELTCTLMNRLRSGLIKTPEYATLLSCLSRLGMSPADRSRVAAPSKSSKTENPFQSFVEKA